MIDPMIFIIFFKGFDGPFRHFLAIFGIVVGYKFLRMFVDTEVSQMNKFLL